MSYQAFEYLSIGSGESQFIDLFNSVKEVYDQLCYVIAAK